MSPKTHDDSVETHYKIRHVPTGEFSTGGMKPKRSSAGKVWKSLGHIATHLSFFPDGQEPYWYKDCVVEEYQLTTRKVGEKPLFEMVRAKIERNAIKRSVIQERSNAEQEARERAELERLKRKYGDS